METALSTFSLNHRAPWREVQRHGRTYLVSSAVIIVPGVLNGSKGALYYPPEQVAHQPHRWDGIPIVNGHPQDAQGKPLSGRTPEVWDSHGLGHIYRTQYQDKLVTEAWIDVEKANRINPQIVQSIRQGHPVEVSTGLFTRDIPAPTGSVHNGVPYQWIATDYQPDHLAILLDRPGACNVQQGCGLNVNQSNQPIDNVHPMQGEQAVGFWRALFQGLGIVAPTAPSNVPLPNTPVSIVGNTGDSNVDKNQLIQWLTTNCECYKDAEGQAALNGMGVGVLTRLKQQAEKDAEMTAMIQAAQQGFTVNDQKTHYNPTTKQWETTRIAATPTTPAIPATPQTSAIPAQGHPATVTSPVLNAEDQEALNWAKSQWQQKKQELIKRLVANVAAEQQPAKAQELQGKSVQDLEYMVQFIPQPVTPQDFGWRTPDYRVAGTSAGTSTPATPTANSTPVQNTAPLPRFYEEEDEAAA